MAYLRPFTLRLVPMLKSALRKPETAQILAGMWVVRAASGSGAAGGESEENAQYLETTCVEDNELAG